MTDGHIEPAAADCPPFHYHAFAPDGTCSNCGVHKSKVSGIDEHGLPLPEDPAIPEYQQGQGRLADAYVTVDDDTPLGNLWITAHEHPAGSGRVPVSLRTETGEAVTATITVEGLIAAATYAIETFGGNS